MTPAVRLPQLRPLVEPLIGLPYSHFLLADTAPAENACWGLVRYLFNEGFALQLVTNPVDAAAQAVEIWAQGDPRDPLTLVQPWDAYILAVENPWSDHLGIVMDQAEFVHVRKRLGVTKEPLHRWRPKLFQVARLQCLM
jgi:hypothetical protein